MASRSGTTCKNTSKLKPLFDEFLHKIIGEIDRKAVQAMKRYLTDVIGLQVTKNGQEPDEFVTQLRECGCISACDVDLLDDLLDVSGRNDCRQMLRDFVKRRPNAFESLCEDECLKIAAAPGRTVAFFVLDDPIDKSNWQRLQLFKSTVLKSLKLVRSEVTLLGKVEFPENKVAFLLPDQVIPHLKHCTGWDKDWLFSLGVMGVQINQETVITVKEVKVAELRLQEDPVLVSPVLRVNEAARTGDVHELRRVLDAHFGEKRATLLNSRTDGAPPLITAARNGNLAIVQALVDDYDVDVEQEGTVKIDEDLIECCTPLWMASLGGHVTIVRCLIDRKAEVNHTTLTNSTPLRAASFNGHTEVVRCLLSNGADVNMRNQDGNTCVMVACWNGHRGTFSLLRNSGARVDVRDKQGFTMIHCATAANNLSLLQELLFSGSDVNARTSEGITPLMLACEKNNPDVVLLLLQRCARVDEASEKGLSAVHFCCLSNSIASLHHLIDYKANLAAATDRGSTPLMLACAKGYGPLASALLANMAKPDTELGRTTASRGADLDVGNENGETCLMMACEKGSSEIARILLDEGADPGVADKNGTTALMIACRRGQERIVSLLLKKNVQVDARNGDGDTALHVGLKSYRDTDGHRKCLQLLLATGASLDIKNNAGETAVVVGLKKKTWSGKALELLFSQGVALPTDLRDATGDGVFHKCARAGDHQFMTSLMTSDSQGPLDKNGDGDTALRAAALEGSVAMVRTLMDSTRGFSVQDKVEALELLGVGQLAEEVARDWDTKSVVSLWQEAMSLRRQHGLSLPPSEPQEFPLQYFQEARSAGELAGFQLSPSALSAQALRICDRSLGRAHSRLPAFLGTIGERFAQIGEFGRSLNIWRYVLELQLENVRHATRGADDVLNTFRCFADAFGFVLSRSVHVLDFTIVQEVSKRALEGLRASPALQEARDKMLSYTVHYLAAMINIASGDREWLAAMETTQAFVRMSPRTTAGATLLHLAASSATEEISSLKEHLHFPSPRLCHVLIDAGIDVNAMDSKGNTALHAVLTRGHSEWDVLCCLLDAGSHIDARNSSGKSAADLARCDKVRERIRISERVASLQCLTARVLVKEKVPLSGVLPSRLEAFVKLH